MNYDDPIYGPAEINEPVLLALMHSAAVQRLQRVLQHGVTALIGITRPTTRFEHSTGVMLLVRRFGGPLEEQIAALLHDASHTAFSHVIDYVFHDHDGQRYHEDRKEAHLSGSDIPALLARYGYDWRDFLDDESFPLLEQPAPALCADRLDYFLRDALGLGLATAADIERALDSLLVYDRRLATGDPAVARWLADTYMAADEASWANFREVGLYELAAQAIRLALASGLLAENDLWGGDREIWQRMVSAGDPALQAKLSLVNPHTRFVWDEVSPDFTISTKVRTLDPDLLLGGELRPLSSVDPEARRRRYDYLTRKQGPWPMRVVPADG